LSIGCDLVWRSVKSDLPLHHQKRAFFMRSLVWFRRDLRINDNRALHHAAEATKDGTVGLFFITPEQWKQHDDAPAKVSFWLRNLGLLSESLGKLNIPLIVKTCRSFDDVPEMIINVAQSKDCEHVCFNREYEVNESRRDDAVIAACQQANIAVQRFHDRVIVPPREIKTGGGDFYKVYTPYRKVWNEKATEFAEVLPSPGKQKKIDVSPSKVPTSIEGIDFANAREDLWPAGEDEAAKRLKRFGARIRDYDDARDIPSINGTSLLSPYLAAGVVSPRQCLAAARDQNAQRIGGEGGAAVWISELIWRDFYTHVMVGFPRVSMHQPFKMKTEKVNWRTDEQDLEAWKNGQTGYPIVDAGMRQLKQTGWMHNRLRMVTAMFLTKNLLIDWRLGEKHFMETLVDGDLAANNGGWQWSASTGTDAVPYFRIFNPFSQSKRFDKEGKFIKKMCPELDSIPATQLHDPKKLTEAIEKHEVDYPAMIVDYKAGRERALAAFKALD
jgi:deoxyribodipyrimidine photo-lyase